MSNKDFQVNYRLNVQAGDGIEQIKQFTTAISGLARTQSELTDAASSINAMFATLNKTFKTGGKKNYTIGFNTKAGVTQLEKVLKVLDKISVKAKSMPLGFGSASIMTQGEFDNLMKRYEAEKRAMAQTKAAATQHAASVVRSSQTAVTALTQLNSVVKQTTGTMRTLNSGTSMVIKTDQAKSRLKEVLGLVRQIKREATGGATMGGRSIGAGAKQIGNSGWSYPNGYPTGGRNSWGKAFGQNGGYVPFTNVNSGGGAPPITPNQPAQRGGKGNGSNRMQSAAINRMHYSNLPSWRNLPFAGMLNAYFMYSAMKSELTDAVAFTHTVDAAKQVLMSTDDDLSTFAGRFSSMMSNVRKIGVDTRFTMVEMAKATQYMAQAGFSTDQINSAIKPISNLALIADAPIQDIADNMTGVLAGYRLDTNSTEALSDQMASTYTRSKATISEMAESFKMASGFLQMAGVDISESIAAFGVLGNANLRGTMAGTSVRSMMTFLAKPSKNSRKTLQKLGVETSEEREVYGKKVRQLRSLADIFSDLKAAGATLEDMSAIFGKIGGTGAMVLASRSEELRELTEMNLHSHGLANKLGQAKQETTSGLWEQVTSQWSESFTQMFESLEPRIKVILKQLGDKISTPEFTSGLRNLGEAMLSVFDIVSGIGTWVMNHWSWIQPLLITGVAAKKILSVSAAIANLTIVLKGVGAASTISGVAQTASGVGAIGKNMAQVVNTSGGMTGAIASIGAFGTGALAAAGAVAAIGGAAVYATYSWYQLEKKKQAFEDEMQETRKFSFPSIEALTRSLNEAREAAEDAKTATNQLTGEATMDDRYSNVTADGSFLDQTWRSVKTGWNVFFNNFAPPFMPSAVQNTMSEAQKASNNSKWFASKGMYSDAVEWSNKAIKLYDQAQILSDGGEDTNDRSRARNISRQAAEKDAAIKYMEAVDFLEKDPSASAAIKAQQRLTESLSLGEHAVNKDLYLQGANGKILKESVLKSKKLYETQTYDYVDRLTEISKSGVYHVGLKAAEVGLSSKEGASQIALGGEAARYAEDFQKLGYRYNSKGDLERIPLSSIATDEEKSQKRSDDADAKAIVDRLINTIKSNTGLGGRTVYSILRNTGVVPEDLLTNKVMGDDSYTDPSGFSNGSMLDGDISAGAGLGGAGRSYGGSGKLSTVAPKQVNVNITNLMSIETIQLMNSEEGQNPQMQDLKGSLTQLLLEVVHDFDSSWNA